MYNLFPKDEFDRDDFLDDDDDEFDGERYDPAVAAQIRKAKQLLNDTKRKQEEKAKEAAKVVAGAESDATSSGSKKEEKGTKLPFFATRSFTSSAAQTSKKIKSKTQSGEIVADGETMAALSKSEAWERRSLGQMFQKEKRVDFDGNVVEEDKERALSEKDLARNIFNLRRQLQDNDFKRVFDDRNRFIGEID